MCSSSLWTPRGVLAGIPVVMGCDYLAERAAFRPRRGTIYTGPIDAYFGHCLGRLAYRGQRRRTEYLADTDWHQCTGQVNEPQHKGGQHIRTLEWKHMMPRAHASRIHGTVITRETPYSPERPDEYEYPFPDARNAAVYREYRCLAAQLPDVFICGRLGEYRYYDMDQAIGRAMQLVAQLLAQPQARKQGAGVAA